MSDTSKQTQPPYLPWKLEHFCGEYRIINCNGELILKLCDGTSEIDQYTLGVFIVMTMNDMYSKTVYPW